MTHDFLVAKLRALDFGMIALNLALIIWQEGKKKSKSIPVSTSPAKIRLRTTINLFLKFILMC